jgi:hypothetical protein
LFYVSGKTAKSKVVSVDPIRHVGGRGRYRYIGREGEIQVYREVGGGTVTSGGRGRYRYIGREGEIQVHREEGGDTDTSQHWFQGEWLNSRLVLSMGKNCDMHRMGG